MKQRIEKRYKTLKEEYETGIKLQAEYEAKLSNLRQTLLRISGAIQVLEEELAEAENEAQGDESQPLDSPGLLEGQNEQAAAGEGT
ncbi:hypothetical protein C7B67_21865 [filamentous cyanobacterium Phorm 6]|nr:hypothetical protein C7B67_21865 [filamentous cyanobacterium Phorm 6]